MQMRKMYHTTNRGMRAAQLRRDGFELQRAGFRDSAQQNYELASLLDPPVAEIVDHETQHNAASNVRKGENKSHNGDVHNRVTAPGGQGASVQNDVRRQYSWRGSARTSRPQGSSTARGGARRAA